MNSFDCPGCGTHLPKEEFAGLSYAPYPKAGGILLCPECIEPNRGQIRAAIKGCGFGKQTQGAFYVHQQSKRKLPQLLLNRIRLASVIAVRISKGNIGKADVYKLAWDGSSMSYLRYPGFFEIRNPILARAFTIKLTGEADVKITEYGHRHNPPVLHRKEQMLHVDHPEYAKLAQQTLKDERAGLLGGSTIGTLHGWVRRQQEAR